MIGEMTAGCLNLSSDGQNALAPKPMRTEILIQQGRERCEIEGQELCRPWT